MDVRKIFLKCKQRTGLTQDQLAEAIGVNKWTLQAWARNKRIPEAHAYKLAELTGIALYEFFEPSQTQRESVLIDAQLYAELNAIATVSASDIGAVAEDLIRCGLRWKKAAAE